MGGAYHFHFLYKQCHQLSKLFIRKHRLHPTTPRNQQRREMHVKTTIHSVTIISSCDAVPVPWSGADSSDFQAPHRIAPLAQLHAVAVSTGPPITHYAVLTTMKRKFLQAVRLRYQRPYRSEAVIPKDSAHSRMVRNSLKGTMQSSQSCRQQHRTA